MHWETWERLLIHYYVPFNPSDVLCCFQCKPAHSRLWKWCQIRMLLSWCQVWIALSWCVQHLQTCWFFFHYFKKKTIRKNLTPFPAFFHFGFQPVKDRNLADKVWMNMHPCLFVHTCKHMHLLVCKQAHIQNSLLLKSATLWECWDVFWFSWLCLCLTLASLALVCLSVIFSSTVSQIQCEAFCLVQLKCGLGLQVWIRCFQLC